MCYYSIAVKLYSGAQCCPDWDDTSVVPAHLLYCTVDCQCLAGDKPEVSLGLDARPEGKLALPEEVVD